MLWHQLPLLKMLHQGLKPQKVLLSPANCRDHLSMLTTLQATLTSGNIRGHRHLAIWLLGMYRQALLHLLLQLKAWS